MSYTPGPFPENHLYLQWGGKLPGDERWSCGLRLYGNPGGAVADAASLIDDYAPIVTALHTSAAVQIAPGAKLSSVKLNAIGVDGHYMADSTNEVIIGDMPGIGDNAHVPPNQVALAVSLTTGFSRGPAHRGRFYLPLPCFPITSAGTITASNAAGCSDQVDIFIAALNAATLAPPAGWKVAVFSRKLGAPGRRAVTGSQVGRVLDTQRRRRRSLVEDYQ